MYGLKNVCMVVDCHFRCISNLSMMGSFLDDVSFVFLLFRMLGLGCSLLLAVVHLMLLEDVIRLGVKTDLVSSTPFPNRDSALIKLVQNVKNGSENPKLR